MLYKEKTPMSGALTGNSGINHTKKYTRNSSQKSSNRVNDLIVDTRRNFGKHNNSEREKRAHH